jgi:hypothetical protein
MVLAGHFGPGTIFTTEERHMPSINETVDRYIASWNETDTAKRRTLLDQTFTADGSYVDPMLEGKTPGGIDAMIAGAQRQFPGLEMRLAGPVDVHNGRARFNWAFVPAGGKDPVVAGIDFVTISGDNRLQTVTGFIDLMPG